jgi:ubiquinone/menaquinone biosynthesis C-methylase UbiE
MDGERNGEQGMADPHVNRPEDLWESPGVAVNAIFGLPSEAHPAPAAGAWQGPHNPREFAQKLYAFEALQPAAARPRPDEQSEPYSLQWFLDIENRRHSKHGRWIPRLLEFAKHSGETLLGVGHGLGTDWVQYAQNGAAVIVCSAARSQLELVRRNFGLRGLKGQFIHAPPTCLPLESASIDVACISSLHHGIDHPHAVVEEVYRVLKPGGKVLAVTPARYDVDFWSRACFFWYSWLRRREGAPGRSSGRELRRLFGQFAEHRIHKRQLRRAEVPHLWRWLPLPLLARLMGRVLVLKAFKPLSSAKCLSLEIEKAA